MCFNKKTEKIQAVEEHLITCFSHFIKLTISIRHGHAAIKDSRGDTVYVALIRERWKMETNARNIAISAMLHRY